MPFLVICPYTNGYSGPCENIYPYSTILPPDLFSTRLPAHFSYHQRPRYLFSVPCVLQESAADLGFVGCTLHSPATWYLNKWYRHRPTRSSDLHISGWPFTCCSLRLYISTTVWSPTVQRLYPRRSFGYFSPRS